MIRKVCSFVFATMTGFLLSVSSAFADDFVYNYIDNGDGTVSLSRYDASGNWVEYPISPTPAGEFSIPEEIDGKKVVEIRYHYFAYNSSITSVFIPSNVTNIEGFVFTDAYGLRSIIVAEDNPSYKSIDGILYTKDGKTLLACPRNRDGEAKIAPGTERIGQYAVYGNRFKSVEFPEGLKVIETYAFGDCPNLSSVVFPSSIEKIEAFAFNYCYGLEDVTFNGDESAIDIADSAFLTTVYDSTKPFSLIVEYEDIVVGFHGVVPETIEAGDFPAGITRIQYPAFSGYVRDMSALKSISIPEGVQEIDNYVFAQNRALQSITLPASLKYIYYNAFEGCSSLYEIRIPSGVEYVDESLFDGCEILTFVYAPSTLKDTFSVPDGCTIEYYEIPSFTVTFEANGGELDDGDDAKTVVLEGRSIGYLPRPSRSGLVFTGWFTEADGGEKATEETVVTADITFYARWADMPDYFSDAKEISGASGTLQASNDGATAEDGEDQYHNSKATLWYKWTAPSGGTMTVDTQGSDFDTLLGVYTGTEIGSLTTIAINDDYEDRWSRVSFTAEEGVTYFVMAGGYGEYTGNIVLNWAFEEDTDDTDAPENDLRENAMELDGEEGSIQATNVGATASDEDGGLGFGYATVWFAWTAPETGRFAFGTNGSSFDTMLGVHVETDSGLEQLDFNDDWSGFGNTTSRVAFDAEEGVKYYVCVSGYDDNEGDIVLSWAPDAQPESIAITLDANGGRFFDWVKKEEIETIEKTVPYGNYLYGYLRSPYLAWNEGQMGSLVGWFTEADGGEEIDTWAIADEDVPTTLYAHWEMVPFETSGDADWTVEEDGSWRSGTPDGAGYSAAQITVVGPVTVSFKWKTSSKENAGILSFPYRNTYDRNAYYTYSACEPAPCDPEGASEISGSMGDWEEFTCEVSSFGPVDLTWTYSTDEGEADGENCGWVRDIVLTPLETCTVTLDANGGVFLDDGDTYDIVCIVGAGYPMDEDGYLDEAGMPIWLGEGSRRFIGWFTEADGREEVTADTSVTGDATLYAHWEIVVPPENDDFAGAIVLEGESGRTTCSNVNAGIESFELELAGEEDTIYSTVWWKWTSPRSGLVRFNTFGSNFDTMLSVYTGETPGSLVETVHNDDTASAIGDGYQSQCVFQAEAGTTYVVRVGGVGRGETGDIVLNWEMPSVGLNAPNATVTENGDGTYTVVAADGFTIAESDIAITTLHEYEYGDLSFFDTTAGYDIAVSEDGKTATVGLKTPTINLERQSGAIVADVDGDPTGLLVDIVSGGWISARPECDEGEEIAALPVNAVRGLWYQAAWGDDIDNLQYGEKVLADWGDVLYLGVIKQTGGQGFYKVVVSEE